MSHGHSLSELLQGHKADYGVHGRPIISTGEGVPDDVADVGWLYFRLDQGTPAGKRLYVWNDTTHKWEEFGENVSPAFTEFASIAASTPLTGTATETVLGSFTIPLAALAERTVIELNLGFSYAANPTTTTFLSRIRVDTVSGTSLALLQFGRGSGSITCRTKMTVRSLGTGANGVIHSSSMGVASNAPADIAVLTAATVVIGPAANTTSGSAQLFTGAAGGSAAFNTQGLTTSTLNLLVPLSLVITGKLSAADASSVTLESVTGRYGIPAGGVTII